MTFSISLLQIVALSSHLGTSQDLLTITFQFDRWAEETTLTLHNATDNNRTIWQFTGTTDIRETKQIFTIEIDSNNKHEHDTCWYLDIADSYGDGICCNSGNGYFNLHLNDYPLTLGNQTFFDSYIGFYWCNSFFEDSINMDPNEDSSDLDCDFSLSLVTIGPKSFTVDVKSIKNESNYWYIDWINSHSDSNDDDSSININIGDLVYLNSVNDWVSTRKNSLCIADGCYIAKIVAKSTCDAAGQYSVSLNDDKQLVSNHSGTAIEFGFCTSRNYSEYVCDSSYIIDVECDSDADEKQIDFLFSWKSDDYPQRLYWILKDLSNDMIVTQGGFEDYSKYNKTRIKYNSCSGATITTCVKINNDACFKFDLYNYEDQLETFELLLNNQPVTFGNENMKYNTKIMYFCANNFLTPKMNGNVSINPTQKPISATFVRDHDYNLTISIFSAIEATILATLTIENVTIYNSNRDLSGVGIMYSNPITFGSYKSGNITLFITNGCYKVNVNNILPVNEVVGDCVVFLNDEIVGYCYKDVSSVTDASVVVCTDKNHISHCITPHFCSSANNISNIYLSAYEMDQLDGIGTLSVASAYALVNVINQPVIDQIDCLGEWSCYNTSFRSSNGEGLSEFGITANCMGVHSCTDVLFDNATSLDLHCFSIDSCDISETSAHMRIESVNVLPGDYVTATPSKGYVSVHFWIYAIFGLTNTTIMIDNTLTYFFSRVYFGIYNITIECSPNIESGNILIYCYDYEQFFIIDDESCIQNSNWNIQLYNCQKLINNTHQIDNINTLYFYQNVTQFTKALEKISMACELNRNTHSVYDIGHSIYSGQSVINSESSGNICCRGAYSCGGTTTLSTTDGNILCGAYQSCKDISFLWTQTQSSVKDIDEGGENHDVYCAGLSSCVASAIGSDGNIICSAPFACRESVVFRAVAVFCLPYACGGANIQKFEKMYIAKNNHYMTIYSGNSENKNIEIWFFDTGYSAITFYCEENDECTIHCDKYSCGNLILYCDGLCIIDCDNTNNTYRCDFAVYSESPTMAPSAAPTAAPTPAPNVEVLLTEMDISIAFNWVMGFATVITVAIIISGFIHASKKRCGVGNDLFNWQIVVIATLHFNDFISDVFFSLRLAVIALALCEEEQTILEPLFLLFVLSVIFVVVPFSVNLFQLDYQMHKWSQDIILKETFVSNWMTSHSRKLYLMAIMTGSSFSAVGLANSYLFKLSAFSMGLPHFYRLKFQTKRFYSVVLLEV